MLAEANINIVNAGAVTRGIQPEVIVRVEVEAVVETLTTPECDLRRRFEHVLHLEERLAQVELKIVPGFLDSSARRSDGRGAALVVNDGRCECHGDIHYVEAVTQHVRLTPG